MQQKDLVILIAKKLSLNETDVQNVITTMVESLIDTICTSEDVLIDSLGKFTICKESLKEDNVRALEFWSNDAVEQQVRIKSGESSVIYKGGDDIGVKCKKSQRGCPSTPVNNI